MFKVFRFFFILVVVTTVVACQKDNGGGSTEFKLSFSSNTGLEKTIKPLEVFRTIIAASSGDENLKGLLITENEQAVDYNRIKINGKTIEGNPIILYAPDNQQLRYTIEITGPSITGSYAYVFNLFDYGGNELSINRDITVEASSPTLKYNGPNLNIVKKGADQRYKLNAVKSDGKLASLEVRLNGTLIDLADIKSFAGKTVSSNPFLLDVPEQDHFDQDIILTAPANAGEITYEFVLTDEFGEQARDSAKALIGEPLSEKVSLDMYSSARNGNSGAMSLITGATNASTFNEAHLIDLGVDSTMMVSPLPWKRQITGSEGVELRYLRNGEKGLPQSFSYLFVETKEQVAILFEQNGIAFTKQNSQGKLISDSMQPGMILVAKANGQYFLIETVLVQDNLANNDDFYRFNLKQ